MKPSSDPVHQTAHADPTPRSAAASGDGNFGGKLKALSISDVLEFLRVLNRRGVLTLSQGSRESYLLVRDAKVVSAASDGEHGNLADYLFQNGQITHDQHEAVLERERKGERVSRVLIEFGILNPRELCEALRCQTQTIVCGLFEWEQGEFSFREGEESFAHGIEVDLPIPDLIADGIRTVKNTHLFAQRMPSEGSVFEAILPVELKTPVALETHERYVLGLIDGSRSLSDVVHASEIGKTETLRVIFLLFSMGYLKVKATQAATEQKDSRDAEMLPLIRRYNEMFAYLHHYLVREVGPIGEAVLGRYFEDQKKSQATLLSEERLGRDGTLDERILVRNLGVLGNGKQAERLIDGLNELLYAELLAVRRTLGPGHEGRAVQGLRELGLQPVTRTEQTSEVGKE